MKRTHLALLGLALASTHAAAGIITAGSDVWQLNNFGSVNDDNVVGASWHSVAVGPPAVVAITSAAPRDVTFSVDPTGGTTEYYISFHMQNADSYTMLGETLQLGQGTGSSFVPMNALDPLAALDFDAPDYDSGLYSAHGSISATPYLITVIYASISTGSNTVCNISVDIPDGPGGTPYTFTIRATGTYVPAPGLAGMMFAGSLAGLRRRPR